MKVNLRPSQILAIQHQLEACHHYWESFVQAGFILPGDSLKSRKMQRTAKAFAKAVKKAKEESRK